MCNNFSFLIVLIWDRLFLLFSLAKALSILFILSKNQLFFRWSVCCSSSLYFLKFTVIFIVSFLLLGLALVYSIFIRSSDT